MDSQWSDNFNRNGNNHSLDIKSALRNIPLFRGLKKSELRSFARIVYVRWYKKNEIIFNENEPGMGMYIIYKGSVKLYKKSELNGEEQISTLIKDDFLGEHSLMKEYPRSASAIALEDCCLLGLFRPDLLGLIDRKPRLGNKIILIFAQRIATRLHQKDEELLQIKERLTNMDFIK